MTQLPKSTDEKLDLMVTYLHRMDRRDRLRTIGGCVSSLIRFIPIAVLLFAMWYMYNYGEQLITDFSKRAAQAAAEATKVQMQESRDSFTDQLKNLLPQ